MTLSKIRTIDFYCEHCGEVEQLETLPPNNVFHCVVCDKDSDIRRSDVVKWKENRIAINFRSTDFVSAPGRPRPIPVPVVLPRNDMLWCRDCQMMGNPVVKKSFKKIKDDKEGRFEFKIAKHCMECDEELENCSTWMNSAEAQDFKNRNYNF